MMVGGVSRAGEKSGRRDGDQVNRNAATANTRAQAATTSRRTMKRACWHNLFAKDGRVARLTVGVNGRGLFMTELIAVRHADIGFNHDGCGLIADIGCRGHAVTRSSKKQTPPHHHELIRSAARMRRWAVGGGRWLTSKAPEQHDERQVDEHEAHGLE